MSSSDGNGRGGSGAGKEEMEAAPLPSTSDVNTTDILGASPSPPDRLGTGAGEGAPHPSTRGSLGVECDDLDGGGGSLDVGGEGGAGGFRSIVERLGADDDASDADEEESSSGGDDDEEEGEGGEEDQEELEEEGKEEEGEEEGIEGGGAAGGGISGAPQTPHYDHYQKVLDKLRDEIEANGPKKKDLDPAAAAPAPRKQVVNVHPRSGFRGVAIKSKNSHSANVYVSVLARSVFLGVFPTPELAAQMYDAAAVVVFGADAVFNFPAAAAHDPPSVMRVAESKLEVTHGRTCKCHGCGQLLPVSARVCVRCRAAVKSDDVQFKGVRTKVHGTSQPRFQTFFCISGRVEFLGTFRTKEEAAHAYDVRAREVHGEEEGRTNYATMEEAEEAVRAGLLALEESGGCMAPIQHKTKKRSRASPVDSGDYEDGGGGGSKEKAKKKKLKKKEGTKRGVATGAVSVKRQKAVDAVGGAMGRGSGGGGGSGSRGGGGGGGGGSVTGGGSGLNLLSPQDRLAGTGGLDFSIPPAKKKTTKSITDELFGSFF
jgi:hypothetical protein